MDDREAFILDAVNRRGDEAVFARLRWDAARALLSRGDLDGPAAPDSPSAAARVLAAWLLTPREAFLPPELRDAAYLPQALPVGHGQTISATYMVTRMTAAVSPAPAQKVLEIGTGSGYQAAMLAPLTNQVFTVETVGPLAAAAGRTLSALAAMRPWLENIRRRTGDGYAGWAEHAPFDRILVTCAIDHPPRPLLEQLAPGGIIILPLGPPRVQTLAAFRRRVSGETGPPGPRWSACRSPLDQYDVSDVYGDGTRVVFVPFVH
jgi:protein-L-isoaspartate(D-aspartate) O-methyltransferase